MINRVVLVGRLTKDPELRYTPSGVPMTRFTVAVNRTFSNQSGEREADFIGCIAWRKQAENFSKLYEKRKFALELKVVFRQVALKVKTENVFIQQMLSQISISS